MSSRATVSARPGSAQTGAASPKARARAQREPNPSLLPAPASAAPREDQEELRRLRAQEAAEKLSAKHSPRKSLTAPVGSTPRTPTPPRSVRPQLEAASSLTRSKDQDEDRDRWVAALFALLLLLFVLFSVPLFQDPALATARATFGARLPLAATACSVLAVVGALHTLVMRSGAGAVVQRLQGLVMLIVACCVCVITCGLLEDTPELRSAAGLATRGLPWAAGLFLLLFGLTQLLRALRQLAQDVIYAALIAALAVGGFLGSYAELRGGLMQERARAALLLRERQPEVAPPVAAESGDGPAAEAAAATQGLTPPPAEGSAHEPQRSGLGADEQDDLAPVEGLDRSHKRSGEALEQLREKVSRSPTSVLSR